MVSGLIVVTYGLLRTTPLTKVAGNRFRLGFALKMLNLATTINSLVSVSGLTMQH